MFCTKMIIFLIFINNNRILCLTSQYQETFTSSYNQPESENNPTKLKHA